MTARALVVGGGWVAQEVWLPRLGDDARFDVLGVVEPDPEVAHRLGVPAWPCLDDAPTAQADVAIVANPNHAHAGTTLDLLARGIPVLVEKPACLTVEELDAIERSATAAGLPVVVSAAARHRSDVQQLADIVSEDVGRVRTVEVAWRRATGVPGAGTWFTSRALAGGGVLFDLGWHLLDLGLRLAGWPDPIVAAGSSSDAFLGSAFDAEWRGASRPGSRVVDVEDSFTGYVTTAGAGVAIDVAWASHEPLDVTSIAVHGEGASVALRTTFGFSTCRVAQPSLRVLRRGVDVDVPLRPATPGSEYDGMLDHLHRVLAGADDRSLAESRQVLRATLLLYGAAGRRTAPPVPTDPPTAPLRRSRGEALAEGRRS